MHEQLGGAATACDEAAHEDPRSVPLDAGSAGFRHVAQRAGDRAEAGAHPHQDADARAGRAESAQFAPTLPDVCGHCGLTPDDIVLVTEALRGDLLTPLGLMRWTLAAARDKLSPSDLAPLLDALLDRGREGFPVAAHLIYTYVRDAPDGIDGLWPQVSRAAEGVTRWELAEGDGLTEYAFESLMMLILSFPKVILASKSVSLMLAAGCGLRLYVFRASEAPGRFKR